MTVTEKTLKIYFPSTEFESQALMITVPNDYKEMVSPQSLLSGLSQDTAPFAEVKNSLLGFNASMIVEIESQEASGSAPSTVKSDSGSPQKIVTCDFDSSESPKNEMQYFQ